MKLSDFELNSENPFLEQTLEEVHQSTVRKLKYSGETSESSILKAVDNNGEVLGHTTFMRYTKVDEAKFAKIYLKSLGNLFDLSRCAIQVFSFMLTCLIPNKDYIYFNLKECIEYTRYTSKPPIYKALAELCQHKIIARSTFDHKYFINPMMIFNGNRITYAETYIRSSKDELEDIS